MTVLVVFLLLIVCGLVGYLLKQSSESEGAAPPDPETTMKAALELHRIRRRLEVAELKHVQRREATRLKRELAEILDDKAL
jgi:hypothetical protein